MTDLEATAFTLLARVLPKTPEARRAFTFVLPVYLLFANTMASYALGVLGYPYYLAYGFFVLCAVVYVAVVKACERLDRTV